MMKHFTDKFKITNGKKFSLKDHDTAYTANYKKEDAAHILEKLHFKMSDCQDELPSNIRCW